MSQQPLKNIANCINSMHQVIDNELKKKPYFGFDQREELSDSEDEKLEQEDRETPQEERVIPDKQMLIEKKWHEEK